MAQNAPLIVRLLASSVSVASSAGKIVRDVMSAGNLGIVEKVKTIMKYFSIINFLFRVKMTYKLKLIVQLNVV